jgi:hypothetical protein
MRHLTCVLTVWLLAGGLALAEAQPAPNAQTAPTEASQPRAATPVEFSGLIDLYYSLNLNHPTSRTNQLRNFDVQANQFDLNQIKLAVEHAADPVGFRLDLGAGRAFEVIHAAENAPGILRNLEQAYFSYKPAKAGGARLDFGKYVTSAGAEVIETNGNYNYSRSLLFSWAIPYYHFGIRTSLPVHKNFTAGFQIVNGWNNVKDNNSGKTIGLTGSLTAGKLTWTHNYYAGPEKAETNRGWRHLYDTTLLLTPHPKANFYINFDYGADKQAEGGSGRWTGVAGAARFAALEWLAFSPRVEWFKDADGFATGTAQRLGEVTLTAEFKITGGLLSRVEYRRDWSDQTFFERGAGPGRVKSQDTVLAGLVAYFAGKR